MIKGQCDKRTVFYRHLFVVKFLIDFEVVLPFGTVSMYNNYYQKCSSAIHIIGGYRNAGILKLIQMRKLVLMVNSFLVANVFKP